MPTFLLRLAQGCDPLRGGLNYGIAAGIESLIVNRATRLGKAALPTARFAAMRPLDQLEQTIDERKRAAATGSSYTAKLLAGGVAKIGAKVAEEAAEVVEAAAEPGEEGRQHTLCEAADVLYHLLVLLAARDIPLSEVEGELARRFGMSGLEEKARREE